MAKNQRTRDRHGPHKTIRLPLSLYKELEAVAEENERPVQWEARIAIRHHIAQQKGKPPPDKP